MKKLTAILLVLFLVLPALCGCGSVFEKEYVSITEYTPPIPAENRSD